MEVLSTAGNDLTLPHVSIVDEGGVKLKLKLTHMVNGLKKTETWELTRPELRLIAQAVFNALEWPE